MSIPSSRRHQFTLRQLLVTLTVICVVLALATPLMRWFISAYGYWPLLLVIPLVLLVLFTWVVVRLALPALRSDSTDVAVRAEVSSHAVGSLGLLAYLSIAVPAVERMFREFDMTCSEWCWLVLRISHAITAYPYLAVPLVAALVAGDCRALVFLHRREHTRRLARTWSGIITALLIGMMAFALWALVREPFCICINLSRWEYPF